MPAGSGLVLFRAAGRSRWRAARGRCSRRPTGRRATCADCLLMAVGGEAVAAELGRGVVSLANTAILSEGRRRGDRAAAAEGRPVAVRGRPGPRPLLDRLGPGFVQVGPWPGADARPGAALAGLVHEVGLLRGRRSRPPRLGPAPLARRRARARRPRVAGRRRRLRPRLLHRLRAPTTPRQAGSGPTSRRSGSTSGARGTSATPSAPTRGKTATARSILTKDRLRPGALTPDDLKLDAKAHPDLGVDLRLLPTSWSRGRPDGILTGGSRCHSARRADNSTE